MPYCPRKWCRASRLQMLPSVSNRETEYDALDQLSALSRKRYIGALRIALDSWRDMRLNWLNVLAAPTSPEQAQFGKQAVAWCDDEIARIESVLRVHATPKSP